MQNRAKQKSRKVCLVQLQLTSSRWLENRSTKVRKTDLYKKLKVSRSGFIDLFEKMLRALGVDVRPGAESPGIKEKERHELTGQPFHRRSRSPALVTIWHTYANVLSIESRKARQPEEVGTTKTTQVNEQADRDAELLHVGLSVCVQQRRCSKTIQRLLSPAQTREKRTTTRIADRLFFNTEQIGRPDVHCTFPCHDR